MQRRIEIDGVTYICNVSHTEETEFWSCAKEQLIADFLKRNGAEVIDAYRGDVTGVVVVERTIYHFQGALYMLHQCEGDLFEWFSDAMCGDFTYYYDKIVFCTDNGFVAAYRDNISNIIKI